MGFKEESETFVLIALDWSPMPEVSSGCFKGTKNGCI